MLLLEEFNQNVQRSLSTTTLASETVHLGTAKPTARVLATDVHAKVDYPTCNQSAMDGYALGAGTDFSNQDIFQLIGEQPAGLSRGFSLEPNQAVQIYTGAPLPKGADRVVMVEHTKTLGSDQIQLTQGAGQAGQHIRRQAEEFQAGQLIFKAGRLLSPFDWQVLAQLGLQTVELKKKLKIGVLATGDELVEAGQPLQNGQLHNSNSVLLHSLLSTLPVECVDYGVTPDQIGALKATLSQAAAECDLVLSTGGVSAGGRDFLKEVVGELGAVHLHKIRMKPGKPVLFGSLDTPSESQTGRAATPYFGLPGNPVSVAITTLKVVFPALYQLMGTDRRSPDQLSATLAAPIQRKAGREEFMRGWLDFTSLTVTPSPVQQSHRVLELAQANCLIHIGAEVSLLNRQDSVQVTLLPLPL